MNNAKIKNNNVHDIIAFGDVESLKRILNSDMQLVHKLDVNGMTPLHLSVIAGLDDIVFKEILQILIQYKSDVNAIVYDTKDTALHLVLRCGSLSNAEIAIPMLVQVGAAINLKNNKKQNPIDIARRKGYLEIVKYFEESIYATNLEDLKYLILQRTDQPYGYNDENKEIIPKKESIAPQEAPLNDEEYIARPLSHRNFFEETPLEKDWNYEPSHKTVSPKPVDLHLFVKDALVKAVIQGEIETVLSLITEHNMDVNARYEGEYYPIHYAISKCKTNRLQMCQLLLENGANANLMTTEFDTTVSLAIKKSLCEEEAYHLVELFLTHGTYQRIEDIDGKDALQLAYERKYKSVVALLQDTQTSGYYKGEIVVKLPDEPPPRSRNCQII